MVVDVISIERIDFTIKNEGNNVMLVDLVGILDAFNSNEFGKIITRFISEGDFTTIIFNCDGLTFLASTGVGVMAHLLRLAENKGGTVILAALAPKIYDVLKLLGFTSFFKFETNAEIAVKSIKREESFELVAKLDPLFPARVMCPVCSKRLRTSKAGKFRCPNCKNIVTIDENAVIRLA